MARNKTISFWLFGVAFMVFVMAIIGAVTRLTESGLSIVEWRPLIGALPPLSESEWQRIFDIYQQTPEYSQKNAGMALAEFKSIFFWEWLHRLWGRLIGAALLLPLIIFGVRKMIPTGYTLKIFGVGCLVGAQAIMGWYMVQSGLIDRPSVSHFRLAAHLSLAFLIFGCLMWLAFDLIEKQREQSTFCIRRHGYVSIAALIITVIWGAFVAGLDAGLLYNTYPLMNGQPLPAGSPDLLNDHGWVQFFHRWIAIVAGLITITYAYRIKSWALAIAVFAQIALGISTLLSQVWMPLATLHQAGAFFVLSVLLYEIHKRRI